MRPSTKLFILCSAVIMHSSAPGSIFATPRTLGPSTITDPVQHSPWPLRNPAIAAAQRLEDGSYWLAEASGPALLHVDANGKLLQPPIPLPDPEHASTSLRTKDSPWYEENAPLRLMQTFRTQTEAKLLVAPWHLLLDDGDSHTSVGSRVGISSEIFAIKELQAQGFPVIVWTVNDPARMQDLLALGVDGIISDRPDLLYAVIAKYDANKDGSGGDFLKDGLIDPAKFSAQGHRGARDLRPENTLPAMEAALDHLMNTLETDVGRTSDGVLLLSHDAALTPDKCRRRDGSVFNVGFLLKEHSLAEIQATLRCDQILADRSTQQNDPKLSPVSVLFAQAAKLPELYTPPSLPQLFQFVAAYAAYYENGPGRTQPEAKLRAANAQSVRFNIETKLNPRTAFKKQTTGPEQFVDSLLQTLKATKMAARTDVQSFDFRTLQLLQKKAPDLRLVFLFGDFPFLPKDPLHSDDGTNLQPEGNRSSPWLAGEFWPYRDTKLTTPPRLVEWQGLQWQAEQKILRCALSVDGKDLQLSFDPKAAEFVISSKIPPENLQSQNLAALPSGESEARQLVAALQAKQGEKAAALFLGRGPFLEIKAMRGASAYYDQLVAWYQADLAREQLRVNASDQWLGFRRGSCRWKQPGAESNRVGYWSCFKSRIEMQKSDGRKYTIELRTLINWGPAWFITHFGAIPSATVPASSR